MPLIAIAINLIIFAVFLVIIFKIVEFTFNKLGYPLDTQVKKIIGLILLLATLVQFAGLVGYGHPIFVW